MNISPRNLVVRKVIKQHAGGTQSQAAVAEVDAKPRAEASRQDSKKAQGEEAADDSCAIV